MYTSSVLRLAAEASSPAFNLIEAAAGGHTVFRVDGLGDVYLGVGGAVRISADGYIQTTAQSPAGDEEDLNLRSAAGQTVILQAGAAAPTPLTPSLPLSQACRMGRPTEKR